MSASDFFFAEAAAGMYDLTIGLVVPRYDLMHQFVLYLLKSRGLREGDTVLDVGSGTGTDSIAILSSFPDVTVVSMDLCQRIQQIHHRKLHDLDSARLGLLERSTLMCADVMSFRSASALLKDARRAERFSTVVTSLMVHHFDHAEKQRFYEIMYELLLPGGRLINADLFSYADALMSSRALRFDLDWMRSEFKNPSDDTAKTVPWARRSSLLKKWIAHYHDANSLEPLEDMGRRPGQITMVRRAGFRSVEVPYRLSLSGILYAEK